MYCQITSVVIGTLRPHISALIVADIFRLCEKAWEHIILPRMLSRNPTFQLRDYLGFAAWNGLYDYVKGAITLTGPSPISSRFKGYLLHCALAPYQYGLISEFEWSSGGVESPWEHISSGKNRLAQWLLDGGTPPSAPHYWGGSRFSPMSF